MESTLSSNERLAALQPRFSSVADLVRNLELTQQTLDTPFGHIAFRAEDVSAIQGFFGDGAEAPEDGIGRLHIEALALRLKVAEDLSDLATAATVDPELEKRVRDNLLHDSELAESLAREYGQLVSQAVAAGQRDQSVAIGEHKLAMRQAIAQIRRALQGETGQARTGRTSEPRLDAEITGPTAALDDKPLPGDAHAASQQRVKELTMKRKKEEHWRRQTKRLKILFGTVSLAAAFGLGQLILYLVPALQGPQMIIVTTADFVEIPAVKSVNAHPPSLFVKVHDHIWHQLDEQGQRKALHRIAVILRQADYNGAKLRDERGNLVAEWIRNVGEYVYDVPEPEVAPEPELDLTPDSDSVAEP